VLKLVYYTLPNERQEIAAESFALVPLFDGVKVFAQARTEDPRLVARFDIQGLKDPAGEEMDNHRFEATRGDLYLGHPNALSPRRAISESHLTWSLNGAGVLLFSDVGREFNLDAERWLDVSDNAISHEELLLSSDAWWGVVSPSHPGPRLRLSPLAAQRAA
jgi:hypothetical protein